MPRKQTLPLVAICGRPNVGKSTLFNRILGKQRAIVHDEAGITRDRFFGEAQWRGRRFRLVDTGGIIERPEDPVAQKMQEQVRAALDEAQVILFVIDGREELTRVDHETCDTLRRCGKPVVLAVNKLDNPQLEENRFEFFALGLGEPHAISSGHGIGIEDLLNAVVEHLPETGAPAPEQESVEKEIIKVAVVGKPNVGKSSFINAILNEERTIVDEKPGTTRDAIDIEFQWKGREYLFIDTAGLRKKAGIKAKVEHFSIARTLRAIRRADVCLVLVDAVEGITEQDKRILGYAMDNGAAMVLAWSKWDLVEQREKRFKALDDEIDLKMPQIKFVPYLTISNVTRQRLFTVFDYVDRVAAAAALRVSTGELNRLVEELRTEHRPPTHKGKAAKIYYATQAGVKPTTFVFFVNQKRLFHFSYVRYLENALRKRYGFEGVPLKLELREGSPKP
ncbi:MAG TPA: ribosome biogenesis GTPase Der [Candidatus Hydrogenedentes bacterium]|nr:ribosome biogenesis GTPase Der [Candidatus Hydrogenedentota bacterium]